jgi:hypothetical protein
MSFRQKRKQIKWLAGWSDSLMWCPSQLTRAFKYDGKDYELYCRWRHDDPWTFSYYEPGSKKFDTWINIGEGLSEDTPIKEVHGFAEGLLTKELTTDD